MQIYIYKNNEQFGPFSSDQIQAYINTNVFAMNDLAWSEGEADWIPLSDLLIKQSNIQDVEAIVMEAQARAREKAQSEAQAEASAKAKAKAQARAREKAQSEAQAEASAKAKAKAEAKAQDEAWSGDHRFSNNSCLNCGASRAAIDRFEWKCELRASMAKAKASEPMSNKAICGIWCVSSIIVCVISFIWMYSLDLPVDNDKHPLLFLGILTLLISALSSFSSLMVLGNWERWGLHYQ